MSNLIPIEQKGKRVLTTAQLAESYGTETQVIVNNFNRNKERYQEGKHFFALKGEEKRQFINLTQNDLGSKHAATLYLWTEKGALLHAKSLNTDKAWEVYDHLVETYFRAKEMLTVPQSLPEALRLAADLAERIEQQAPLVAFAETAARSKDSVLIRELAKICCKNGIETGERRLYRTLREWGLIMQGKTEPYQEYIDRGYFRTIEQKYTKPDGTTCINIKTLVYQRGLDYIRKILTEKKAI